MKKLMLLSVLILALGVSAWGATTTITTSCPNLQYAYFTLPGDDWDAHSLSIISATSSNQFTIQYACAPVRCLWYGQHVSIFPSSATYGIYLENSSDAAHEVAAVGSHDPRIIRSNIQGKEAAIEAAQALVQQGVCAESAAMPNPSDI